MKNVKDDKWIKKHRYGSYAISDSISRLAALNFAKRGLGNGSIIREWSNIWPLPWSKITIPRRIRWSSNTQNNGVLEIALQNPSMGAMLLHEKNHLIEKINIWFGYGAIKDIRIARPTEKNTLHF